MDNPNPMGRFTRNYDTPAGAYGALLRALAAGPPKEE